MQERNTESRTAGEAMRNWVTIITTIITTSIVHDRHCLKFFKYINSINYYKNSKYSQYT